MDIIDFQRLSDWQTTFFVDNKWSRVVISVHQ